MQGLKQIFFENGVIPNTSNSRYIVPCPIHGEHSGKSLSISFDIGVWRCFGKCKNYGKISSLMKILGLDYVGLIDIDNYDTFNKSSSNSLEESPLNWDMEKLYNFNKYHSRTVKYLKLRGISSNAIETNHITFNNWNQRIYMPVWCNNECYGYVSRTTLNQDRIVNKIANDLGIIEEIHKVALQKELIFISSLNKDEIKDIIDNGSNELVVYYNNLRRYRPFERYLNNYELRKEQIVYEPLTNVINRPYIVCEGIIDALKCSDNGYNSFAVLGTGLTSEQVEYMLYKSGGDIILGFDNDNAGNNFVNKFNELAKHFFYKINWSLSERYVKDIGDLSNEEFKILVKSPILTC